eukprot:GHVH01009638.1.p1 GENE.GHVH01009638.1~~GHVH01009638.1.p1  ORF type:complete len:3321 (+),score=427.27 GHVH01009638.1:1252-9963(+)
MFIHLQMKNLNEYFMCSVIFDLKDDYQFELLNIKFSPEIGFVKLHSVVPIYARSAMSFDALHASLKLDEEIVSPTINFEISDGHMSIKLSSDVDAYTGTDRSINISKQLGLQPGIHINSKNAPIDIVSGTDLDLVVRSNVAAKCILRADTVSQISKTEILNFKLRTTPKDIQTSTSHWLNPASLFTLWHHNVSRPLTIGYDGSEAPVYTYVTSNPQGMSTPYLEAWVGKEQLADPHFGMIALEKFQYLIDFVKIADTNPWITRVNIIGNGVKVGYWRFVSSAAFLGNYTGFLLMSGGILRPKYAEINTHVIGLFCRHAVGSKYVGSTPISSSVRYLGLPAYDVSHSSSVETDESHVLSSRNLKISHMSGVIVNHLPANEGCHEALLEDQFRIFWNTFEALHNPSIIPVWTDNDGNVTFDVKNDAVILGAMSIDDKSQFQLAIVINILLSSVAAILTAVMYHANIRTHILGILRASLWNDYNLSHRLDNEPLKSDVNDWHVNVIRQHGQLFKEQLIIRWTHGSLSSFDRIAVRARPVPDYVKDRHLAEVLSQQYSSIDQPSPSSHDTSLTSGAKLLQETIYEDSTIITSAVVPRHDHAFTPELTAAQEQILKPDEIFVVFTKSHITMVDSLGGTLKELAFPLKNPMLGQRFVPTRQKWRLEINEKYRIQLVALDEQGAVIEASNWSQEIRIDSMFTPLNAWDVFGVIALPHRKHSLRHFTRRHLQCVSRPNNRLQMFDISMIVNDGGLTVTGKANRDLFSTSQEDESVVSQRPFAHSGSSHLSSTNMTIQTNQSNIYSTGHSHSRERLLRRRTQSLANLTNMQETSLLSSQRSSTNASDSTIALSSLEYTVHFFVGESIPQSKGRSLVLSQELTDSVAILHQEDDANTPGDSLRFAPLKGKKESAYLDLRKETESVVNVSVIDEHGDEAASGVIKESMIQESIVNRAPKTKEDPIPLQIPLMLSQGRIGFGTLNLSVHSPLIQQCISLKQDLYDIQNKTIQSNNEQSHHQSKKKKKRIETIIDDIRVDFIRDFPGTKLRHGKEYDIHWIWVNRSKSSSSRSQDDYQYQDDRSDITEVYLHLFDHLSNRYLGPLHHGRAIPNTGVFSWVADADMQPFPENPVRFAISLIPISQGTESAIFIAMSHAMYLRKYLLLSEFEIAYATYCRAYLQDMEPVSKEVLKVFNIECSEEVLRVCKDLRTPLPFEDASWECIRCPRQVIVSPLSKLVFLLKDSFTMTGSGRTEHLIAVYKSQSVEVTVIDDYILVQDPYWWENCADFQVLQNDVSGYLPFQESNDLTLVPHLSLLEAQRQRFKQYEAGGSMIRSLFNLVTLGYYFYFDFAMFMLLLIVNYVNQTYHQSTVNHLEPDCRYYIDFFMRPSLSFLRELPESTINFLFLTLFFFICDICVLSLKVSNRLYTLSIRMTVFISVYMTITQLLRSTFLFFLVYSWILWGMVSALINGAQFLPLVITLGCFVVVGYSTWARFTTARKHIRTFVKDNLDNLVAISLDNWYRTTNTLLPQYFGDEVTQENDALGEDHWVEDLLAARTDAVLEIERTAHQNQIRSEQRWTPANDDDSSSSSSTSRSNDRCSNDDEQKSNVRLIEQSKKSYQRWSIQKVSAYYFFDLKYSEQAINNSGSSSDHEERPDSEDFSLWKFWYESCDGVTVLRNMPFDQLPPGCRLATCSEVLNVIENDTAKTTLIHGSELVALKDGYICGPQLGFVNISDKDFRELDWHRQYEFALIAIPVVPPSKYLLPRERLALLFDTYCTEKKKCTLTENEFRKMWRCLKKIRSDDDWSLWYSKFCQVHAKIGAQEITFSQLENYYQSTPGLVELDLDYCVQFPDLDNILAHWRRVDTQKAVLRDQEFLNHLDDSTKAGKQLDSCGLYDVEPPILVDQLKDITNNLTTEATGHNVVSESDSDLDDDENDAKDELGIDNSFHAIKVRSMFEKVTTNPDGPNTVADMTKSELSKHIVEAQYRQLSPFFTAESIVGKCDNDVFPQSLVHTFVRLGEDRHQKICQMKLKKTLAVLMMDTQNQVHAILSANSKKINEPKVIYDRVAGFYDATLADVVQTKTGRIVNSSIPILADDLHPENAKLISQFPPRTTCHVMDLIAVYRIQHSKWLHDECGRINSAQGVVKEELKLSFLTQVLVDLNLLSRVEDINEVELEIPSSVDSSTENVASVTPKRMECHSFLTSCLDDVVDNTNSPHYSYRMMPEHIVEVVKSITSKHLWFNSLQLLVRIMGIDLFVEELPISLSPSEIAEVQRSVEVECLPHAASISSMGRLTTYKRNAQRMKNIFEQLSGRTGFLPVDLADEAFTLLTNSRIHIAAVQICLQRLQITSSVGSGGLQKDDVDRDTLNPGSACAEELTRLGYDCSSASLDLEYATDRPSDILDWKRLGGTESWPDSLIDLFDSLSKATPGFMSKSQMIEFARQGRLLLNRSRVDSGDSELVSFEVFTEVLTSLRLSISRKHSKILWCLITYAFEKTTTSLYIPSRFVAQELMRIYFQPTLIDTGEVVDLASSHSDHRGVMVDFLDRIEFKGCLTFSMFAELLKRIQITPKKWGIRNLWTDMNKCEQVITPFLPEEFFKLRTNEIGVFQIAQRSVKTLRLAMDIHGLNPTDGATLRISNFCYELPRKLMTGLWPEVTLSIIHLNVHITADETALFNSISAQSEISRNRYGLIKAGHLQRILATLHAEGMPLNQLYDVVQKMQLQLHNRDLRRMFNVMDLNQDKTLDEEEFFTGFTVLFGNFVPNLVIDSVKIHTSAQVRSLFNAMALTLFIFLFIGMSFSAFTAGGTASTAMQSLLAIVAAFSYQSTSSNQEETIQKNMIHRMERILGEGLEKKLSKHRELNELYLQQLVLARSSRLETVEGTPPPRIRYVLPQKHLPDTQSAVRILTVKGSI